MQISIPRLAVLLMSGVIASAITTYGACPENTRCVGLTQCPLLMDILSKVSCPQIDSFKVLPKISDPKTIEKRRGQTIEMTRWFPDLSCGYKNQTLVCCPHGGEKSPYSRPEGNPGQAPDPVFGLNSPGSGKQTNPQDHPWAVQVGFKLSTTGQVHYLCGGSLITSTAVLTTVECAANLPGNLSIFSVKVGEHCMEKPHCNPQVIPVESVILHPNYDSSTPWINNIAIVRLKSAALGAVPIYMQEKGSSTDGPERMIVGFGLTHHSELNDTKERAPKTVKISVVGLDKCSNTYIADDGQKFVENASEHLLCAGGEKGRSACAGFGGSPLLYNDTANRRLVQVGITTTMHVERCGENDIPGLYTRTDQYFEWIKENLNV